jgi:type II secretory pathway pseudopilin PulG
MNIPTTKMSQGMASLTLVLIVVAIVSLIMIPIFLMTQIRNNQAVRLYHSLQAFYAAEGSYAETISRIKKYDDWIPVDGSYSFTYEVPPNNINLEITRSSGVYTIETTAENRIAQRKIEGSYTPLAEVVTGGPYDLVLVLDYSSSMNHPFSLPDSTTTTGMVELKKAVPIFLDTLYDSGIDVRVGIVRFSKIILNWPLSPSPQLQLLNAAYVDQLKNIVNNTNTDGGTNHFLALDRASLILNDPALYDASRTRIIIFFSDGSSSFYDGDYRDVASIDSYKIAPDTPLLEPAQYTGPELRFYGGKDPSGISASDPAIKGARDLRRTTTLNGDNAIIYTIFYKSYADNSPDTLEAGRYTLFAISSEDDDSINKRYRFNDALIPDYHYYRETDDPTNLSGIFSAISDIITSGGNASYRETVPD